MERSGCTMHARDVFPGLDGPPQNPSGSFFDRWGDSRCNSSATSKSAAGPRRHSTNTSRCFSIFDFRLNDPLAMFLQPWEAAAYAVLCSWLVRRGHMTEPDRLAGWAVEKSPVTLHRDPACPAAPRPDGPHLLRQHRGSDVCLQSALPIARGPAF